MPERTSPDGFVSRRARLAVVASLLTALAAPEPAHARPDDLPFELAVVLHGCRETPFGADRLADALADSFVRDPVTALPAHAARVRVVVAAPRCGASDRRVQVTLEVGEGNVPWELVSLAPAGETPEARSADLAREVHAALARRWPGVLAAADVNPYAVRTPLAITDNPYRHVDPFRRGGARGELLPPNPYRR